MKRLWITVLCTLFILAYTTCTLATEITTSGEFDFNYYFSKNGKMDDATLAEVGLYNNIYINDTTSAYLGLWLETNGSETQNYNIIDDAYILKKLGKGSLKVGYGRYNVDGPLDILGNGFFAMKMFGGSLEPAIQILYSIPVNDALTLKTGYFYDWGADTYSNTHGRDVYTFQGTYAKGNWFGDATYLGIGKKDSETENPADEYILDAGYNFNKNFKVYASYLGANPYLSGFSDELSEIDNFTILGAKATYGKLSAEVESAVSAPNYWRNSDGDKMLPFGFIVEYRLDGNSKLRLYRSTNTNSLIDFTRIRYIITF